MKKNDLNQNYWEHRYRTNSTGWDIGAISTPLKSYIDQIKQRDLKILIPGAGNGHEVEYLWDKGFRNLYAADIAKTALQNLKSRVSDFPEDRLLHCNFFDLDTTFDLIIEQTFFCALEPGLRTSYVKKMNTLLNPSGKLVGLLFNFPFTTTGPPFGGDIDEYTKLFSPQFYLRVIEPSLNSVNARMGKELFFIFEKK
jgi:hypothetical protein